MSNKILQWNSRGIRANYEKLILLNKFNPKVVCFQETFLKDKNPLNIKHYQSYNHLYKDGHRVSGGVSMFVREDIPQQQININSELNVIAVVAERTSYFCLACKLIWPLWSSHIFTQGGWLILFSPDHFPDKIKMVKAHQILSSTEPFEQDGRSFCLLPYSIRITTPWGKPSDLWTFWVYSLRPRVPSWTWIRCI